MEATKKLIVRLIEKNKTDGLLEKVNAIYLNGGLTEEEYNEVCALLNKDENPSAN